MPIFGKSPAAKELLAQQTGDLKPNQIRALNQSMTEGKRHYLTQYRSPHTGAILCPSNPYEGKCLHAFGQQLWHEQGLGKTYIALEHDKRVREFLRSQNDPRASLPSLIITVNSVKWQIASIEIPQRRSDLLAAGKVVVIDGDKGIRQSLFDLLENNHIQPEIIILTYSHLSKTTEGVFDYLQGCDFLGLYRDEAASQTSNPASQRAVRLNAIKRGFTVNMAGYPQSREDTKTTKSHLASLTATCALCQNTSKVGIFALVPVASTTNLVPILAFTEPILTQILWG
jgi:hypothetical protein